MSGEQGTRRPYFFDDPGIDALYQITVALAAEVGKLQARVSQLEGDSGAAHDVDAQRALIDRVFGFLKGPDGDKTIAWTPYASLIGAPDREAVR